jgi:uncharacterized protein
VLDDQLSEIGMETPRSTIPIRVAIAGGACIALLTVAGLSVAQSGVGAECDRLAASPNDRMFGATGVEHMAIDAVPAREACRAAREAKPDEPRYAFQLGRAEQRLDNFSDARQLFEEASKGGYKLADVALGILYEHGLGVDTDVSKALDHYKVAADAGIGVGLNNLAGFYLDGVAAPADPVRAAELYRQAVAAGYTAAAGGLASALHDAWKEGDDPKEVVNAYIQAADHDIGYAHTVLGHFYRDGSFGLPVDPLAAMSHYREGMQLGDDWGSYYLAQMLAFSGPRRSENLAEAEALLRRLKEVEERGAMKAQAMAELGRLLASRGDLKDAAALIDNALAMEPENSAVLAAHARLLARALDFEGADRALAEAIEGDPDWAPYLAQRAEVQEKLGDKAEATGLRLKASEAAAGQVFLR